MPDPKKLTEVRCIGATFDVRGGAGTDFELCELRDLHWGAGRVEWAIDERLEEDVGLPDRLSFSVRYAGIDVGEGDLWIGDPCDDGFPSVGGSGDWLEDGKIADCVRRLALAAYLGLQWWLR